MTFLALLEAMQQLRKQEKKATLTQLETLIVKVQDVYVDKEFNLLQQTTVGLELEPAEQDNPMEIPPYSDSSCYSGFYYHFLYQKLLPLCQFANLSSSYSKHELLLRQHNNYLSNTLIKAARYGRTEAVQSILSSSHCSPEVLAQQDKYGWNALIFAVYNEHTEIVQAILSSPHCSSDLLIQQDKNGCNALIKAAQYGHTETAQAILSSPHCSPEVLTQQDKYGCNALILAAHNGYAETVQAILASPHCNLELLTALTQQKNNGTIILKDEILNIIEECIGLL
jgi:ankyrin repeat protein